MHCKKCGKAIGTDRGICPFCGAMLSPSQYEIYKELKKDNMLRPDLLTEKYGEKKIIYDKRSNDSKLYLVIIGLFVLIIMAIIILFVVLI